MKKIHNRILKIHGNVIELKAENVRYGDLALVYTQEETLFAEIIKMKNDEVMLQVFGDSSGISTSDRVEFLGEGLKISCSPNLLGRVFDSKGRPKDKGPALVDQMTEIRGATVNPVKRIVPSKIIHTQIPMIDLFNSLVESQKISIFTRAGEPVNQVLAKIAIQADVDHVIVGGMGLRYDNYLYLKKTLEQEGILNRSVFFIHTAADPAIECLLVPDLCLVVAESYALKGKRVLVLLNDMTNFSDALKEIAISMEKIPSNRGYPGDLYSQLAARYEKAIDFENAGSITILSVTSMPGNDVTHPVPDNTGYITEGQYYLVNGRIEPFGSLSRLKQLVNKDTREDHRPLMDSLIRLYSLYQETMEKVSMGFNVSSWDQKLIKYGNKFETEFMDLEKIYSLDEALDIGWKILSDCFETFEVGLRRELIDHYWSKTSNEV